MIDYYCARRTKTYAAADVNDADGVKTSFATATSPVVLTTADFNGAAMGASGLLDLARTITITRSNNAGQFSTGAIVLTGTRGGSPVTETLTPANANGNDVLRGVQAFDFLTSISIPAQGGTGGTFLIGVQDICAPDNSVFMGIELAAAGTINIGFGGGNNGSGPANTDAIPVAAAGVGIPKSVIFKRVLTSSALASPTNVGLTVYLA